MHMSFKLNIRQKFSNVRESLITSAYADAAMGHHQLPSPEDRIHPHW